MAIATLITTEELARRIERIPRVRLANLPTPLAGCPNLTAKLSGPPIYIKRDDLAGLATGGNKSRYLEFVLADAIAKGADTVVLSSGNQSNHCRQLAAVAAKLGLRCVLLLWGSEPTELEGNVLLDVLLGAEVHFLNLPYGGLEHPAGVPTLESEFASESPPSDRSLLSQAIGQTMVRLRGEGRIPYCLNTDAPEGLAAIGYVQCALELAQQMRQAGIDRAEVFVTTGGATHAGLLAGSLLLGAPFTVTGISYHARTSTGRQARIAATAAKAASLLGFDLEVLPDQVKSDASYATDPLFAGTDLRWQPVLEVACAEGILLEPSYSGRAMLAIADRIKAGSIRPDQAMILIHTGGLPLLFLLGRRLSRQRVTERRDRQRDGPATAQGRQSET